MNDFAAVGTLVGLLLGLMHTAYLVKLVAPGDGVAAQSWPSVLSFAAWTLLLWLLMGAYVLGFWLIGLLFWLVFKAFRS